LNAALPEVLKETAKLHLENTTQVNSIPQLNNIPRYTNMDTFCAALKNPVVFSAEDNSGTEDFQNLLKERPFMISELSSFSAPIPFVRPAKGFVPDPSGLKRFSSITQVSNTFHAYFLHFLYPVVKADDALFFTGIASTGFELPPTFCL
jgi:hypothetical protein